MPFPTRRRQPHKKITLVRLVSKMADRWQGRRPSRKDRPVTLGRQPTRRVQEVIYSKSLMAG